MPVNFTKFPFPGIHNPQAVTLTEAVRYEPVSGGFVIVCVKGTGDGFATKARAFAQALRAATTRTGLTDVTAYREILPEEFGGAIPFDQPICERWLQDAERFAATQPEKFPALMPAVHISSQNEMADWTFLLEYATTDQALAARRAFNGGEESFQALIQGTKSNSVNAFKNTMRYANVSRDPDVIQFFNLFPGPGDVESLWAGWQEALPWFFEVGEFRSSFPLVALDPDQPLLLVNYAHTDSLKHFFLGVSYDPTYLETVKRAYQDRGFKLPLPFFCKIVPV